MSMHGALLKDWETHRCDVKLGRGWRIAGHKHGAHPGALLTFWGTHRCEVGDGGLAERMVDCWSQANCIVSCLNIYRGGT